MDEATFEKMHAEDRMAHDKLKEGIEGFSAALEKLEKLLADRLAKMGAGKRKQSPLDKPQLKPVRLAIAGRAVFWYQLRYKSPQIYGCRWIGCLIHPPASFAGYEYL